MNNKEHNVPCCVEGTTLTAAALHRFCQTVIHSHSVVTLLLVEQLQHEHYHFS